MDRILVASHQQVDATAYGPSHLQQGGSLTKFLQWLSTEANCAELLKGTHWLAEFLRPRCADSAHCLLGRDLPRLLHRNACRV